MGSFFPSPPEGNLVEKKKGSRRVWQWFPVARCAISLIHCERYSGKEICKFKWFTYCFSLLGVFSAYILSLRGTRTAAIHYLLVWHLNMGELVKFVFSPGTVRYASRNHSSDKPTIATSFLKLFNPIPRCLARTGKSFRQPCWTATFLLI